MVSEFQEEQGSYGFMQKLRDLEQNQKLMKERILLIGQNLIESQDKDNEEIIELKKKVISMESDLKKAQDTIRILNEAISKTARKEEIAILERQYKMFEPLKLARIKDIEQIIDKKLKEHKPEKEESNFWRNKI